MPRFVLLYHACPPDAGRASHWDFMLEAEGTLRTWALERLPIGMVAPWEATIARVEYCPEREAADEVDAMRLPDHRMEYLTFEGELTGGRGNVIRVDRGLSIIRSESPSSWNGSLEGNLVRGEIELRTDDTGRWRIRFAPFAGSAG